jgi:replicative DNA helicase
MSDFQDQEQSVEIVMPPASIQAEEALLGAMLMNADVSKTVEVNPGDFYVVRNRWIYEAIRKVEHSGIQVDHLTVCDELERAGTLEKLGGLAYLMKITNSTPTSMHAESYAEIIKDRAQRRRMIEIAGQLARAAYNLSSNVDATVSQSATDLANTSRPKGGAQHASVFASRHYDRVDALADGRRVVQRIPTGFVDFDRALNGGLRIPEMLLLAGKPGLGKTKFIFQLGFNMGKKFPGAIYEMETDEDQIMDREISRRTHIPDTRIETGKLNDDEWPKYVHSIEEIASDQTRVYLDFGSGWTTASLRADLARLKAEYGIVWYMIDYMKFLRDDYGKDETERLNHISGKLKAINRELGLASVVIHSMNKRGIDSQSPDLTDQSGGADISFDTDKSLFMMPHVPPEGERPNKDYRTFIFRKSRSRLGDTVFHLKAVSEYPQFLDIATKDQDDQERKMFGGR